jgi:hypothetical protein
VVTFVVIEGGLKLETVLDEKAVGFLCLHYNPFGSSLII